MERSRKKIKSLERNLYTSTRNYEEYSRATDERIRVLQMIIARFVTEKQGELLPSRWLTRSATPKATSLNPQCSALYLQIGWAHPTSSSEQKSCRTISNWRRPKTFAISIPECLGTTKASSQHNICCPISNLLEIPNIHNLSPNRLGASYVFNKKRQQHLSRPVAYIQNTLKAYAQSSGRILLLHQNTTTKIGNATYLHSQCSGHLFASNQSGRGNVGKWDDTGLNSQSWRKRGSLKASTTSDNNAYLLTPITFTRTVRTLPLRAV